MLEILPCSPSDILPFKADGKRAGLVFSGNTEYFGAYLDGRMVGMAGIVLYKTHAKLKSGYVLPDYRNRGIYTALLDWRIEYVRRRRLGHVEATCTAMSLPIYLKHGAKIIKRYKAVTKVRIQLANL